MKTFSRKRSAVFRSIAPLLLLLLASATWAQRRQPTPKTVPTLRTRWANDVSPTHPLPEYPRPQMVRQQWLNLNGPWDYAITPKVIGIMPTQAQGHILVPYPVESALSGVQKSVGPFQRLWYRRSFLLPESWSGNRILLHFGAVDWDATVYVNDRQVAEHKGGYDAFTCDITDALTPSAKQPQEIVVCVWDPTDAGYQAIGKQRSHPGGIFYTSATGIWQTVWLEPVPEQHISGLVITPDLSTVHVTVQTSGAASNGDQIAVTAMDGKRVVAQAMGNVGVDTTLSLPQPHLWTPQDPYLYNLQVSLLPASDKEKPRDSVDSYFALRTVALGKDDKGITRPLLNGKFVFQVGALDQGYWPDGIYTAPTDAALRSDIDAAKKLGFNLLRKHAKVEPDRWYYWTDRLGMLVWQDMPQSFAKSWTPEATQQFETELRALIAGLRNHPSIIQWTVFNEGWGQHDTETLVPLVKQIDPSRLVDNASGWTDKGVGDVIDMHKYPSPGSPTPEANRAAVLGEFGGLGLPIPGHMWQEGAWGYQKMSAPAQLTGRYERFLRDVYRLRDDPGLSAVVYTQLTDVETESNGLLTYDRAIVKPEAKRIAAANRGEFLPGGQIDVVPTAMDQPNAWRYTFDRPADTWFIPAFDDSAWKTGPAGFGTKGTPGAVVRTTWDTSDIWLRRSFSWPKDGVKSPALLVHHDEDVEIYINGVLAAQATGFTSGYTDLPLRDAALAALKPGGENILAVHCHQTTGGQYVDVGIEGISQ